MILKQLKLKNFLSFKELDLKFPSGLYLVEGYNFDNETSNGSGKTTIFNAITYCLYGKTPRNCKLDDFARWGSDGSLFCQLDIQNNNDTYKIVRQRSPDKLELYINDIQYKEYVDNNELNNKISSIVGISYNCFINSVYYAQNRLENFLIKNDENKKKILTEIVGISEFDTILQKVKDDHIILGGQIEALLYEHKILLNAIDGINSDIRDYEKLNEKKIEDKKNKIKYLTNKIEAFQNKIKNNIKLIEENDIEFQKIDEYKNKLQKVENKKDKLAKISEKIVELRTERKNIGNKIIERHEELKKYENFLRKGMCFTCGQIIHEKDRIDKLITDIKENIEEYKNKELSICSEINSLNEIFDSNKIKINNKYTELLSKYNDSLLAKGKIKSLSLENDLAKEDIERYKQELKDIDNDSNDIIDFRSKKEKELHDSNLRVLNINENIKEKQKELIVLNYLKNIFGKDGIRAVVFNQIIDELNSIIDNYVNKLFEIPISLNFEIVTNIKDGTKIVDKINTVLSIKNKEIDFNLLSGGEQKRLILAVDFALSEIMSRRNNNKFDFLILDEVFDSLDSNSKVKFMEFLQYLKQNKEQIFVIDHNVDMKNIFDHIINIEKRNEESIIV